MAIALWASSFSWLWPVFTLSLSLCLTEHTCRLKWFLQVGHFPPRCRPPSESCSCLPVSPSIHPSALTIGKGCDPGLALTALQSPATMHWLRTWLSDSDKERISIMMRKVTVTARNTVMKRNLGVVNLMRNLTVISVSNWTSTNIRVAWLSASKTDESSLHAMWQQTISAAEYGNCKASTQPSGCSHKIVSKTWKSKDEQKLSASVKG